MIAVPAHLPTLCVDRNAPAAQLWLALPEAAREFCADALSVQEAARFAGMKHAARRRDFMVSRSLQHYLQLRELPIGRRSHSDGHAALLHWDAPTRAGVDLEKHSPRRLADLARFGYSAAEAQMIESRSPAEQTRLFYALWTLKEAAAKALGLPLLEAIRTCTFIETGGVLQGSLPIAAPWTARVFEPLAGFSLAVVCLDVDRHPDLRVGLWPSDAPGAVWPEPLRVAGT